MCRLFCWVSSTPISAAEALEDDQLLLTEMSKIHNDGWGGAFLSSTASIDLEKEIVAAYTSDLYQKVVTETHASSGMIHLRWATGNYAVCLENTHPFLNNGIAFEHNGGFENAQALAQLIDADVLNQREGETDSEWYFLLLQTLIRKHGTIELAYKELIPIMKKLCPYSSLNAMILTPDHLYVVSAYDPERHPIELELDYYHLSWEQIGDLTCAWSSGVRSRTGVTLDNYSILRVDNKTQSRMQFSIA